LDFIQAIIIGVIEGVTEFLPISSTGHMIIASHYLGLGQSDVMKAYEVIIQFAAILAVMLIYEKEIRWEKRHLWYKLFIAFLPLALVGFLLKDWVKSLFSVEVVSGMFIVGGVLFLVVEYFYKLEEHPHKEVSEVTYKEALFIGLAQLFALIPGTSRSGATILGGMLLGLNRKVASDFSFLLAIPVMGAVTAYDFLKHYDAFVSLNASAYWVGFGVAFVTAFITVKLFLHFIQRFSFVPFGLYRILFGCYLLYAF
jgi:undecaprenyl-diphosphatase